MSSMNLLEARKNLNKLIENVNQSHEPVHITNKHNSAVIIAEEDWKAINETLYLCSIPGMRKSIIKGMAEPVSKCSKTLDW